MQILHRFSFQASADLKQRLQVFGIEVPENGLSTIVVPEAHPAWASVEELLKAIRAVDIVETRFTEAEITASDWLEMVPEWQCGYPGPRPDDFGYLDYTYDRANYCTTCGTGLAQIRAFRLDREPRWGSRSAAQLNWVFDEIFVTPSLWQSVFRPLGVGSRPVENLLGGIMESTVQLVIEEEVALEDPLPGAVRCETCGTTKLSLTSRGYFPAVMGGKCNSHISKTNMYFGEGSLAYKGIVASRELHRAISASRSKGFEFRPCASLNV